MQLKAVWQCPYCGRRRFELMEVEHLRPPSRLVFCDPSIDADGCGRRSVLDVQLIPETHAHRITEEPEVQP